MIDFDGSLERRVHDYLSEHPAASSMKWRARSCEEHEGSAVINVISPRIFEAAAASRTTLVLFPGELLGAVEPWVHYIPLDRDFATSQRLWIGYATASSSRNARRAALMSYSSSRARIHSRALCGGSTTSSRHERLGPRKAATGSSVFAGVPPDRSRSESRAGRVGDPVPRWLRLPGRVAHSRRPPSPATARPACANTGGTPARLFSTAVGGC